MKDSAKLRRHLHLIRFLDRLFSYPSKRALCEHLRSHNFEQVSTSTLERDLGNIRADYGIATTYDRRNGGLAHVRFEPAPPESHLRVLKGLNFTPRNKSKCCINHTHGY